MSKKKRQSEANDSATPEKQDASACEPELREAHRLFVAMSAMPRADEVAAQLETLSG